MSRYDGLDYKTSDEITNEWISGYSKLFNYVKRYGRLPGPSLVKGRWLASALEGADASAKFFLTEETLADPAALDELREFQARQKTRNVPDYIREVIDRTGGGEEYYDMFTLPEPDEEQQAVVDAINSGANVVLSAAAGSGKTTTILSSCASHSMRALILTYNASLKTETREKIVDLGMVGRVEAHSYHAAAMHLYGRVSKFPNDEAIVGVMDLEPRFPLSYEIIYVDECQDMREHYFMFVVKVVADCVEPPQVVMIGDKNQCIYDYGDVPANTGYMDSIQTFLEVVDPVIYAASTFVRLRLSSSYRITPDMGEFVNEVFLIGDTAPPVGIVGRRPESPDRPSVEVVYMNSYNEKKIKKLMRRVFREANEMGLTLNDVAILSGSTKASTPVATVTNVLSAWGIPLFVKQRERNTSTVYSQNKLSVCTFHAFKGLEREMIVLFGFDSSYDKYFKREKTHRNSLYVGLTRAKQKIFIVASKYLKYLLLVQKSLVTHRKYPLLIGGKRSQIYMRRGYPVTDLLGHISYRLKREAADAVSHTVVSEGEMISYRHLVTFDGGKTNENVSPYYGNYMTLLSEYNEIGHEKFYANVRTRTGQNWAMFVFSAMNASDNSLNPAEYAAGLVFDAVVESYFTGEKITLRSLGQLRTSHVVRDIVEAANAKLSSVVRKNTLAILAAVEVSVSEYVESDADPRKFMEVVVGVSSLDISSTYQFRQISDYTWPSVPALEEGHRRVDKLLPPGCEYEKSMGPLTAKINVGDMPVQLIVTGRADVVSRDGTIYEIKFVKTVLDEHMFQVAVYALMDDQDSALLFNARTDTLYRVTFDRDELRRVVSKILLTKIQGSRNTDEFVADTVKRIQALVGPGR